LQRTVIRHRARLRAEGHVHAAATIDNARIIRLDRDIGSIEKGREG
jgi:imidazolonepropionase-like amidohydrolase